jgi:hypothetical protein
MNIFQNDYAVAWLRENGYPSMYQDGLYAWLEDVYPLHDKLSFQDLLAKYLKEYGDDFNMIIAAQNGAPQSVIMPASTFTTVTPTSGGSGLITLTSAGIHSLTEGRAVGSRLFISGGTLWEPGYYPITAIPSTTSVTISGTFDAGMGNPTIALANTEVTFLDIPIPALLPNSVIRVDCSVSSVDTSASKTFRVKLGSGTFIASSVTLTSSPNNRKVTVIHNRNSTDSQIAGITLGAASGEGNTGTPTATGTEDTSIPSVIYLTAQCPTANVPLVLERHFVEIFK